MPEAGYCFFTKMPSNEDLYLQFKVKQ